MVIMHKDSMGIRDRGSSEVGHGGCVGTARGVGDHAQGQYGDQGVHSGGGVVELALTVWRQMGVRIG